MKLPNNHLRIVLSGISIPNSHAGPGGKLLGRLQRVTRLPAKYPRAGDGAEIPACLIRWLLYSGT